MDFGPTDIPLNREELAKAEAAGGAVLHIPTVLGAITVTRSSSGSPAPAPTATTAWPRTIASAAEDMAVASVGDFSLSLLPTTDRAA